MDGVRHVEPHRRVRRPQRLHVPGQGVEEHGAGAGRAVLARRRGPVGQRTGVAEDPPHLRRVPRGRRAGGQQQVHGPLQQAVPAVGDLLHLDLAPPLLPRAVAEVGGHLGGHLVVGDLDEDGARPVEEQDGAPDRREGGHDPQRPVEVTGAAQRAQRRRHPGGAVVERLVLLEPGPVVGGQLEVPALVRPARPPAQREPAAQQGQVVGVVVLGHHRHRGGLVDPGHPRQVGERDVRQAQPGGVLGQLELGLDLDVGSRHRPIVASGTPGRQPRRPGAAPGGPYPGPVPVPSPTLPAPTRRVAITSLGCARNDVDSEELAGRLQANGWELVDDASEADVAVVNTCGFVEQAKKDSVDTLLEAAQLKDGGHDGRSRTQAVVAVGCLAERYGAELADSLPEADAVLGFDSYADLHTHLQGILAGERPASHTPRDRRLLLPLSPVDRQAARATTAVPGTGSPAPAVPSVLPAGAPRPDGTAPADRASLASVAPASGPPVVRARLGDAPWASLKLASGCDRRCTFCAIPAFRGSFVSRRPTEVLDEARWLAERGVREVFLVSENTTSYGKDLGDLDLLQNLLPEVAAVDGIERVRVSYLQPAELRPGLLRAIATTPGVAPYYDLSFQHAAPALLRRMRRFGGTDDFLALVEQVRALAPTAGIRSNVIVGFPGETEDDVAELVRFLQSARLDVVGVFGYSDEDGTEAAGYDGKHDADEVAARVEHVSAVVDELVAQRAEDRLGERVDVLVEEVLDDESAAEVLDLLPDGHGPAAVVVSGRAAHQGPDVDGSTAVVLPRRRDRARGGRSCPPPSWAPTAPTCSPSSRGAWSEWTPGPSPATRTSPTPSPWAGSSWSRSSCGSCSPRAATTPGCAGGRPACSRSPRPPTVSTATSPAATAR